MNEASTNPVTQEYGVFIKLWRVTNENGNSLLCGGGQWNANKQQLRNG